MEKNVRIHRVTPLIKSQPLSDRVGKNVWLKMDCLQETGSFKIRGMGQACQNALRAGFSSFVSSSGGNAGLATAWCGRVLDVETTVCLPETAPQVVRRKIQGLGSKVVVAGSQWSEANAHALGLVAKSGGKALLVHPFDMADLWEGHATLVEEVREQLEGVTPDLIVGSVGGGGLLMGILTGLKKVGWEKSVKVLACETHGADALAQSLREGKRVKLAGITSVAKSLGADKIGEEILAESARAHGEHLLEPFVATDEEAVASCLKFALDHNVLVEPACGAALAPLYFHSDELKRANDKLENIVVEVCGGGAFNGIETLLGYADALKLDKNGDKIQQGA